MLWSDWEYKKGPTRVGFKPTTFRLLVRCCTNWAIRRSRIHRNHSRPISHLTITDTTLQWIFSQHFSVSPGFMFLIKLMDNAPEMVILLNEHELNIRANFFYILHRFSLRNRFTAQYVPTFISEYENEEFSIFKNFE